MKILMVAIPNHHFFQWVNQLEHSGHEVYWFDITDGGPKVERINWVHQIKGWKLRFNYPFRHTIKNKFPRLYKIIQKYNDRNVEFFFQEIIADIQPDIVHSFEMKLAGIPILNIMEQQPNIKFIYSSWGSDLYFFKQLGILEKEVKRFLTRVDYLITDCKRDHIIAVQSGFKNTFLGVLPGNGGILINKEHIQSVINRKGLLIKGYEDGVGKALIVLEALELVSIELLKVFNIVIYSADEIVKRKVAESNFLSLLNIRVIGRDTFMSNNNLLKIMGESAIHIANSISDGMPNVLLESMGMGAFPIQSNPGKVAEEVMKDGINGYLIENPLDHIAIAKLIVNAINNIELRTTAQDYNVAFIAENFNRKNLQKEIVQLYNEVFLNKMYNK